MSQNNSNQQFGVGNMQIWQQQMVYKQIQELQRQQQLQQLDQGARQQNLQNCSSVMAKPAVFNQLPSMMNEMPINNASNFTWVNNFAGGMPTFSNNSQMVNTGNMDWTQSSGSPTIHGVAMHNVANDIMISHEQSPLTRTMGYVPQQTDQSFYGMPVSSSRLYGNQYSQFSGMSANPTNLMTDRGLNHAEKALEPFNSFQSNQSFPSEVSLQDRNSINPQNFQGNYFHSSVPMELLNGDFQQVNSNLQMSTPVQNSQSRQNFYSQEEPTVPVGTSGNAATLDPTEQKILFGTDEDDDWGASFSGSLGLATGGYQHGSSLENGSSSGFPSIQSGSWSALMQEAVQSSTSEKGVEEEWSGLTLQTTQETVLKNSFMSDENGKQMASWGDNHKPITRLGSTNATPFKHSFMSTGDNSKKTQNDAFKMPFPLSSSEDSNKQFNQIQKHKQHFEGDVQVQNSAPNGAWAVQSYQQLGSISTDMSNLQDGWSHQKNMSSSCVPISTSNFYDNSGNIWGDGQNIRNLNGELQSLKPTVGGPEKKTDDSVVGNFRPLVSSNSMRMTQQTSHDAGDSSQAIYGTNFSLTSSMNDHDESAVMIKNGKSQMTDKWVRSFNDNEEGLAVQKRNENQNDISHESSVPSSLSDGHATNMPGVAKGSPISSFYDQSHFIRGNQKSGNETNHIAIATKSMQNSLANTGSNARSALPSNHQSNFPGFSISRNEEPRHVDKSNNTGHVQSAALLKGVGNDVVERNINSVNASDSSAAAAAQHFQNSKNAYSSQNMLELLHKVDQSKNFVTGTTSDATGQAVESESSHPIQSAAMQGYGLRLAPPAQWHSPSNYALPHATNDTNNRQLDKVDAKDQPGSDVALPVKSYNREAYPGDNSDSISDMSKQKHIVAQEQARRYVTSPTIFSKVPRVGNQLEDQNQKSLHYDTGTRNKVEPQHHQQESHNFNSSRVGAFSSAGAPSANSHALADSGFYSADGGNVKQPIPAVSHQKSSGQQCSIAEARSGLHPSLSGMSQQPGSSKMLHNVWAKLSAQQRLAGMQPQKLTPQLLQSIINSGKGASLRGLQNEVDRVNRGGNVSSETGISSGNSQNEDNEIQGESSTVALSERVDNTSKSGKAIHWQEPDHPHQQDVKGKKDEEPSVSNKQMLSPATANATSSSQFGVSQHMLTSSSQHQSYSLLHQMQAMKDGHFDPSKLLGKRLRSADLGCNAQDLIVGQRFVYGQNALSGVPSEGKDDAVPLPSQSECNMVSFVPKDDDENVNTSADRHVGFQNQVHLLTPSSSNLIGGSDRPQVSPQMAPAWFEKYGNDKNGLLVASYDGQKITNAAAHQYFHPRIPGNMENSAMTKKITESFQEGTTGHGALVPTFATNESSRCSALPSGSDHGVVIRSKKRRTATSYLFPWHKVVASGPSSFQSISMPEQEWAQATNRLMEQVDNEAESLNYTLSTSQPHKRLILTTKLMQCLLPAVSNKMLKAVATDGYESLTFCIAKSALSDACSLMHSAHSNVCSDQNNLIPKMLETFAKIEESLLLKVMKNFIDRSEKLENDLQRLDKKTSLLDVRLECQEIEKCSIVNRLGKFHGRPQSEVAETSSTSEGVIGRTLPRRYVTAVSVPGNLPENVPCLSL